VRVVSVSSMWLWDAVLQATVWRRSELGRLHIDCTAGTTATFWGARLLLPHSAGESCGHEGWSHQRNSESTTCLMFSFRTSVVIIVGHYRKEWRTLINTLFMIIGMSVSWMSRVCWKVECADSRRVEVCWHWSVLTLECVDSRKVCWYWSLLTVACWQ